MKCKGCKNTNRHDIGRETREHWREVIVGVYDPYALYKCLKLSNNKKYYYIFLKKQIGDTVFLHEAGEVREQEECFKNKRKQNIAGGLRDDGCSHQGCGALLKAKIQKASKRRKGTSQSSLSPLKFLVWEDLVQE